MLNPKAFQTFLNWFRDYFRTREGRLAITVVCIAIASGLFWGDKQFDEGKKEQSKSDSLFIAEKKERINELKAEKNLLQMRIDTMRVPDCMKILKRAEEVRDFVQLQANAIKSSNKVKETYLKDLTESIKDKENQINILSKNP